MILSKELTEIRDRLLSNTQNNIPNNGVFLTIRNNNSLHHEITLITNFLNEDYNSPPIGQRLWHIVNGLFSKEICVCGRNKNFYRFSDGYHKTCGDKKCKDLIKTEGFKKTINEKYNGEFLKKGSESRKKYEKTMMDRYKSSNNLSGELREKIKKTMVEKYGVENPLQSEEIKNKRKNTCIKRYGSENFIQGEKSKNTMIEKYGNDNPMKIEKFKNESIQKSIETLRKKLKEKLKVFNIELKKYEKNEVELICEKCNRIFVNHPVTINAKLRFGADPCISCNPFLKSSSNLEKELVTYIKGIYNGDVIENSKIINIGKKKFESDVYLPDKKIAFEFNGLYWHSEIYKSPEYHSSKTEGLLSENICLYHIWEDDWLFKKDIIKSIIKSRLGLSDKIWARKCYIKEISNSDYKKFCENNHLQGYGISSIRIGLLYENELVSVMGFSKTRKIISGFKDSGYELVRFCSKKGINIIGGASKMLSYFESLYKPEILISYCDISISPDPNKSVYSSLGFYLMCKTSPGYHWVIDGKRIHRLNFTKHKLIKNGDDPSLTGYEIMSNKGYYRIWDAGNYKFIKRYNKSDI